ncbi:MAG TPA: AMP-binding protein [Steroidobacteraceae bacterium]|nr:AMP-binding protein [Steroidobacteraceae bacterium]
MEKYWLNSYPKDVPTEIDPSQYASLKELAEKCCAKYADRDAYVMMDRAMSFGELERESRAFAAWLQQEAGAQRGTRIALMMPNLLQYPVAMFGALRAGLTIVNVNPLYTWHELEHQVNDSGAEIIVVLENFAHVVQKALPSTTLKTVVVTSVGEMLGGLKSTIVNFVVRRMQKKVPAWDIPGAHRLGQVLARGRGLTMQPVEVGPDDIAFLQYTGGTTGVSKGAVLTHRNMVANVLQGTAWFGSSMPERATYVIALPLYHIFSLTANALMFLLLGGRGILITDPRDLKTFVKTLQKYPPNLFMGVNTLFNGLLHTPGFAELDHSSLAGTVGGGMAVQAAVAEKWKATTGCVLSQGWGLTETSPIATMNPMGKDYNGSIGLPVPSTGISIRNDAGTALGIGEIGEICVRGPQVMRGYWNRPAETAEVMLPDGWLRTGDIGRMDEAGFVYIEDRKKDMILVSGFNVYPNEVEGIAAMHPGVLEAAAVAKPDERSGEAVALFVVRKDPALTEEALISFMRESLTAYKVPKFVYFRNELPKTNVGKILRRTLRDDVA